MNYLKIIFKATYIVALFLTISKTLALQEKADEKVLSNFDSRSPLAGWRISSSKMKLELETCKQINTGKALKINFDETKKESRQVLFFNFSSKDWRKYETFEFDLFCPTVPTPYKLTLCGADNKSIYMFLPPTKQGLQHCIIALDKPTFKGGDISKMSCLYFSNYTPSPGMTLYVDNFKLVDYTSARIKKIGSILEKISTFSASGKVSTKALVEELVNIENKYSHELNDTQHKTVIGALAQIRLKACQLLKKSMNDNPSNLTEKADLLYDLIFTCNRTNSSYSSSPNQKEQQREEFIVQTAKEFKKSLTVKEKINKNFIDEDFAIGTSNIPIYLSDYPQSFDGNFNKSIQLYAARREYEPFQIILMPQTRIMKNVTITASDLTGPAVISKDNIEVAPMGWRLDSDSKFKADMLRPDIKKFDVKKGYQQPVWINVFIPEQAKPGDYFGTIKITANGMKLQTVKIKLKIWPFKLPKYASLKNAVGIVHQTGKRGLALSKMVNNHRINYSNIYDWKQISLSERKKFSEMGTSMFNLLCYRKNMFFEKADAMYKEICEKDLDFLNKCYVYGFDEVTINKVPTMEKTFGEIKKRYSNIKTMCAINKPLWKFYPYIKNLDIWVLTLGLLTPQVKAKLEEEGKEVWWYNLFSKSNNPFTCRIQFWATYKDKLEGVLFYNLRAGNIGRYQKTLYPTVKRTKDGAFDLYGLIRENHNGYPVSTVAFECWREGMEDHDYLTILEELKNKLVEQNKYPELSQKAEKLLRVPDYLTKGMMKGWSKNAKDGCLYTRCDSKANLNDLMGYRKQLGNTIAKILEHIQKD